MFEITWSPFHKQLNWKIEKCILWLQDKWVNEAIKNTGTHCDTIPTEKYTQSHTKVIWNDFFLTERKIFENVPYSRKNILHSHFETCIYSNYQMHQCWVFYKSITVMTIIKRINVELYVLTMYTNIHHFDQVITMYTNISSPFFFFFSIIIRDIKCTFIWSDSRECCLTHWGLVTCAHICQRTRS